MNAPGTAGEHQRQRLQEWIAKQDRDWFPEEPETLYEHCWRRSAHDPHDMPTPPHSRYRYRCIGVTPELAALYAEQARDGGVW